MIINPDSSAEEIDAAILGKTKGLNSILEKEILESIPVFLEKIKALVDIANKRNEFEKIREEEPKKQNLCKNINYMSNVVFGNLTNSTLINKKMAIELFSVINKVNQNTSPPKH